MTITSLSGRSGTILPMALASAALLLTTLTGCASQDDPSTTAPPVGAQTQDDRERAMQDCLKASGWDVEIEEGGAVTTNIPQEQVPQWQAAVDACDKSLGFEVRPLTNDELAGLYGDYVEAVGCLKEHGYSPSDPPSAQTFQDTYASNPWSPWNTLPADDQAAAIHDCPQPPAIF